MHCDVPSSPFFSPTLFPSLSLSLCLSPPESLSQFLNSTARNNRRRAGTPHHRETMSTEPLHRCTSRCRYHDDCLGTSRQWPISHSRDGERRFNVLVRRGLQCTKGKNMNLAHSQMCNLWQEQKMWGEKNACYRIQAHDRIDCDLVTHFPHAAPPPPQPPT